MKKIFFVFAVFAISMQAQTTKKISELDTATTIASTDRFLVTAGGTSKAMTFYRLTERLAGFGGLANLSGTQTVSGSWTVTGSIIMSGASRLKLSTTAPSSPQEGSMYWNTGIDALFIDKDGAGNYDTLTSRAYLRTQIPVLANVVQLSGTNNMTGNYVMQTNSTLNIPPKVSASGYSAFSLFGDANGIYYSNGGDDQNGTHDTLVAKSFLRGNSFWSLMPRTHATYGIGTSGTRWKDAYFSGIVNASGFYTGAVEIGNDTLKVLKDVVFTDSSRTIGSTAQKIDTLYAKNIYSNSSLTLSGVNDVTTKGNGYLEVMNTNGIQINNQAIFEVGSYLLTSANATPDFTGAVVWACSASTTGKSIEDITDPAKDGATIIIINYGSADFDIINGAGINLPEGSTATLSTNETIILMKLTETGSGWFAIGGRY